MKSTVEDMESMREGIRVIGFLFLLDFMRFSCVKVQAQYEVDS